MCSLMQGKTTHFSPKQSLVLLQGTLGFPRIQFLNHTLVSIMMCSTVPPLYWDSLVTRMRMKYYFLLLDVSVAYSLLVSLSQGPVQPLSSPAFQTWACLIPSVQHSSLQCQHDWKSALCFLLHVPPPGGAPEVCCVQWSCWRSCPLQRQNVQ